ncbi:cationic amino acid transporter 3 isoform X2 [Phlebotomus papatasi]|uniref:cationic amino acid transporter 3 isoform X2 n=1 Tax=Phlebotomus papatasi TaxID=29031 RepID=UPI002483E18F|nr:cationic amino acid transporter 3 isoform X2 [Phlebotomus papatasi]XP_055705620.1 cationic amino acid transporter 3 isoform X2 [Phlebotomus papatasi]
MRCDHAYETLRRKKPLAETISATTKLAKVLTTLDLTALGIGSTLGVGVYVLAGEVSKTTAGPAVVISFAIAAIASIFAGLCYAEFGARVPKAGSAYIYSYVTIGEFIAFVIGWNLVLEYAIGSASVVKGLSTYLDSLIDHVMSDAFKSFASMNAGALGDYVDFFAFGATMVFSIALALGVRESVSINNIFTLTNLAVVLYVVVTGAFRADPANWSIPPEDVPTDRDQDFGQGGFAPYGFAGIIKGAAICFYGFIGFDCIATASEEARNPRRSIPLSIIISLSVIFVAYFSISTIITMMLPYFDQDVNAPLPHVFRYYGWTVAQYIVSVGAIFGLCASLMGAMFPLPRVIYAMSIDGLIFEFMGRIHPRFKTPLIGTLVAGFLTGTLAAIFNLDQLVSMMSIGTLLAYSMVAGCVLLLRYEVDDPSSKGSGFSLGQFLNIEKLNAPTRFTSGLVTWSVTIYCVWCLGLSLVITQLEDYIDQCRQPRSSREITFTVPLVPWLPGLSILINIYLMTQLDVMTWIRFGVWILAGLIIYFTYGIWHSGMRFKATSNSNTSLATESRSNLVIEEQSLPDGTLATRL